jgi:hypothetical protein
MSCEKHSYRIAETDFYLWMEDSADIRRKTIFGNPVYYSDFHFGRVDKLYCIYCTARRTDRFEAIGDYGRQPEWWSWQGREQSDIQPKHWRPHALDWGCEPHRVWNVMTEEWINYG